MANYRSLVVGGFFSSTPLVKSSGPVSIRMNNPGAVNGAAWERIYPGYVTEIETTPGNRSTIFETPEHGVAVWYELMKKYRAAGAKTVEGIIIRYGGGQANYATGYVPDVVKRTGLSPNSEIKLEGDDATLLKFAKAMFRHEAGRDTPLSDAQILYGFKFAREYTATGRTPLQASVSPTPVATPSSGGFLAALGGLLSGLFGSGKPQLKFSRILKRGDTGPEVKQLQERLKLLGHVVGVDSNFGPGTLAAVRKFQVARNIDPDGEVGDMTTAELNSVDAKVKKPALPAPTAKFEVGVPPWYKGAERDIGFHETGNNQGIESFIAAAKTGKLGDAYCAIWVNAKLESAKVPGTRSAMARSFERHAEFVKLSAPALGCVVTMWRTSPSSGSGHVFFYDGENSKGIRGIGANEDDSVKRSFHTPSRITGYWWPKSLPLPVVGKIVVNADGSTASRET